MPKKFVTADLHMGHDNVITFKREDGSPLRDFRSIAEHDGTLIHNWNNAVSSRDVVYVLGDAAWGEQALQLFRALNGRKVLVRGNHDNLLNVRKYLDIFEEVYAVKPVGAGGIKCVLTHVPMHSQSVDRWGINVHGHLHDNIIDDNRYINVSVEQTNYTPVELGQILQERVALQVDS